MRLPSVLAALCTLPALAHADVGVGHAEPTVLVTGQGYAENLTVDDKYIYWSPGFGKGLLKVSKHGGQLTTIDTEGPIYAVALAGEQLLYSTPEGVKRISRDGHSKQLLVSKTEQHDLDLVQQIVPDGQRLLLLGPKDALLEAPINGGAAALLVSQVAKLAVDRDGIYFSPFRGRSISFLRRSGGVPTVLVQGEHFPLDIVVDDSSIYWISEAGNSLKRAPRQGGRATTIAKGAAMALLGDRDAIYWVRAGSPNHTVMRYRKSDGNVAQLAPTHGGANLALDEGFVYFADHRAGTIAKVPK